MEIQQLCYLIVVVENCNLLKVVDKVYILQLGFSCSFKSFEYWFGVLLLICGFKGVELIIYGLFVICCVKVILNEVVWLLEEVCVIENGCVGEMYFGVMQNYVNYLMFELFVVLYVEWLGLLVNVLCDGFFELVKKVKIEEIDFVFGLIGCIYYSDGIVIELLMENCLCVVVCSCYLLVGKCDIGIDDFVGV